MEWKDLGESNDLKTPSRTYYPSISINAKDLAKKVEVGDDIELRMKCKVVSTDMMMGEAKKHRLEMRKMMIDEAKED